jgi:rubrerythrin
MTMKTNPHEDLGRLRAELAHTKAKLRVSEKERDHKAEMLRDAVEVLNSMAEQETCPGCGFDGTEGDDHADDCPIISFVNAVKKS